MADTDNIVAKCEEIVVAGPKPSCEREWNAVKDHCSAMKNALSALATASQAYQDAIADGGIDAISAEISVIQPHFTTVNGAVKQAEASIATAQQIISEGGLTESQRTSFLNSIKATQQTLQKLQNDLAALNTKIDTLKAKIEAIKDAAHEKANAEKQIVLVKAILADVIDTYNRCWATPASSGSSASSGVSGATGASGASGITGSSSSASSGTSASSGSSGFSPSIQASSFSGIGD